MPEQSPIFVTKGPLDPERDQALYQKRKEDADLWDAVQQGNYVALLGARQTGKTSLLHMLGHKLLAQGTPVVFADLSTGLGEAQKWYPKVCNRILDKLGVVGGIRTKLLADHDSSHFFDEFLRELAWYVEANRIVILLDEIDGILKDVSEPFIWAIRSAYNSRIARDGQPFQKYVFVLSGSRALQKLTIKGKGSTSPLNICEKIYASDLSEEAADCLIRNLERAGFNVPQDVIAYIYGLTSGHPYLTSRICAFLERQEGTIVTQEKVDAAVGKLQEDDDYLVHLIGRLDADQFLAGRAECILLGERMHFTRISPVVAALELIGAIKKGRDGRCQIRNKICKAALREYFEIRPRPSPPEKSSSSSSPIPPAVSSKRLGIIATSLVVAMIVGGVSRDWLTTLASIVLFWSLTVIVFYLKDIRFADNTKDPDRQFTIQDIRVTSFYAPVIHSGQEHTVTVEVRHPSPTVVPTVTLSLDPRSENISNVGTHTYTLTKEREVCEFKVVLVQQATFLDLLLPFAQQQNVALLAEVNQETKASILKMNADFSSTLFVSILTSIASLISFALKVAEFFKK